MRRSSAVLASLAVAALALAPSFADARAGSGSSSGSRGSRTYSAPPTTNTAPSMAAPMERSMTPRPAPSAPMGAPAGAPQRSGFGSGLMGGLAGGLLGVGLGSMLMGHGLFGGGGMGGFGFIGLLLQMALLFFVGRWLFRMFLNRSQPVPAGMARMGQPAPMGMMPGGMGGAPLAAPVAIGPADFAGFEQVLKSVQEAWSKRDLRVMGTLATPEMVSYFADQLADQASRGVQNTVTDVKLEQGDLAEAWNENGRDYATVAMRYSMLDVTRDSTGRVVDGDMALRTMATEIWTFVRSQGGHWLLSAIQQTR